MLGKWFRPRGRIALAALCSLSVSAGWGAENGGLAQRAVSLLTEHCAGCHGGESGLLMAGLDLTARGSLFRGGDSGRPAIDPVSPERSLLIEAVEYTNPDLSMPPSEEDRLSEEDIQTLRKWIEAGAEWPGGDTQSGDGEDWGAEKGVRVTTSGGQSEAWDRRLYHPEDLWAYQPLRKPDVPPGGAHPIDAFINRRLIEAGLTPAPPADAAVLVRRLHFVLTGLPPAPEDVLEYARGGESAYESWIERLLDSPRYGEQMARHWLDVTRYADSGGFSNDFERPNAWRYRDYVIRAFNKDKPYTEFIREQIAGDELDGGGPETLIASGFLRMGPWEHTAMSVEAITRQQFLDDVTNAVGQTFLAQGLRCARCHDHKFDPIPTRDYYRFQAIFAPVQFADREAPYLPEENISSFSRTRPVLEERLKNTRDRLNELRSKHREAVKAYLAERGAEKESDLPEGERPDRNLGLTPHEMSLLKVHQKHLEYHRHEEKRYEPFAFGVYNGPPNGYRSNRPVNPAPPPEKRGGPVQPVHILAGGSPESPGEEVNPGPLSVVEHLRGAKPPAEFPDGLRGRRLALADWIANPENPLTARVIVNRVWQWHFGGNGLVATPNNFGKMGAKPTHPELLDWLAAWFMENGWSIKKLHRLILTSETFRRSGNHPDMETVRAIDPDNQRLAYYPPRRLAAEEIRDAMLACSGELNWEMGGPGTYPEINWEIALQPRHIMGSVAPAYQPSVRPEDRNRRTIYTFRRRTLEDPMLEVFNRPGGGLSCARRDETTVAPQAFALFNGRFSHGRALAMALRLRGEADAPGEQIRRLFLRLYGRAPAPDELELCLAHYESMLAHHREHRPIPRTYPREVRREMIEELTGEPFVWVERLDRMDGYQPGPQAEQTCPETRALKEVCLAMFNSNEFLYLR